MVHTGFWFMQMMLKYWEKAYILHEKRRNIVVASKVTGLETNADKTKYMVMSRDERQNEVII